MTKNFVGAYWGARAEPREVAAKRLAAAIAELSGIDRIFGELVDCTRPHAPIFRNGKLIADGTNFFRAMTKEISVLGSERFGVSARLCSPDKRSPLQVAATIGSTADKLSNSVYLKFEDSAPPDISKLKLLMQVLIDQFDPENAVAMESKPIPIEEARPIWELESFHRYSKSFR